MNNYYHCLRCGYTGKMKEVRPGSAVITFILLWLFVIPALIYSQWRWSARKKTCPRCQNTEVIPARYKNN